MYTCRDRCERIARYMVENGATVRSAAAHFGISKSTVHKDVTTVLEKEDQALFILVRELLEKNKAERHVMGRRGYKTKIYNK